jgi:hypothetical protein
MGDATILTRLKRRFFEKLEGRLSLPHITKEPKRVPVVANDQMSEDLDWDFPDETISTDGPILDRPMHVINTDELSVNTQIHCGCGAKSYFRDGRCVLCSGMV